MEPCLGCAALVRHERELREAEMKALAGALVKAEMELARRLDELNHAAARAVADREAFVTRERFDGFSDAYDKRARYLDGQLQAHAAGLSEIRTVVSTLRAIVAVVGTPGILALLWALIAAAVGKTVTGSGGLLP